jgi:hypothetical protein
MRKTGAQAVFSGQSDRVKAGRLLIAAVTFIDKINAILSLFVRICHF